MLLKSEKEIKRWLLLCLIPILGGFGAICAVYITVNGRLTETDDNKKFKFFPLVISAVSAVLVFTLFICLNWTLLWHFFVALAAAMYIAGYANLLCFLKYIKKEN